MNFFLLDVWKQSKIVFAFFILFILGTIGTTYYQSEVTPFFLWAHYSERKVATGTFDRIYIKVNGNFLDLPELSRPTREMIQLPTEYFVQLEGRSYETSTQHVLRKYVKNSCSDSAYERIERRLVNRPSDREKFLQWLSRYIERVYDRRVNELEVGRCLLVVQADRSVKREEVELVAKWSRE